MTLRFKKKEGSAHGWRAKGYNMKNGALGRHLNIEI